MTPTNENLSRRAFLRNTACGAAATGLALSFARADGPAAKTPILPYGTLGRIKYPATLVSLGAIQIAGDTGVRVLKAGIDAGINLLHTSAGYTGGKSVAAISELFKADKSYREKVLFCLKSFTPDKEAELDGMLKALGLDHTDVLLSTIDKRETADYVARIETIRRAQESLKKQGKIRYTGFVCHTDMSGVMEAVLEKAPDFFDVALLSTAPLPLAGNRKTEKAGEEAERFAKNLKALRAKGVGILSMKSGARNAVKEGSAVFETHVKSLLSYGVDTVLTSFDTLEQVTTARSLKLKGASTAPADAKAAADFSRNRGNACLMCGSCSGACPQGVPVNDLMRVRMYHEEYGWRDHARAEFAALGNRVPNLVNSCGNCSQCGDVCPAGLASGDQVQRIVSLLA